MDLFTYLLGKKGQNTQRDLFSYLLGKGSGGSGTYTTFTGISFNISNTLKAKIKNFMLNSTELTQDGTPTPDTPQDIHVITGSNNVKVENENLFDKLNAVYKNGYYKDGSGNEVTTSISGYTTSYTKVKPNTIYTISGNIRTVNANGAIYCYTNSKNWISRINWTGEENTSFTFTTPNNCYYIQFQYTQEVIDGDTVQLEQNATATKYVEHQEQNYPINLGNLEYCKIRDYADHLFKNTKDSEFYDSTLLENEWYLKKNIGKIDSYNGETITTPYISTTGGLDTEATIYYGLTTPTYIHISQADYPTLKGQLDNLYNNAKSYDGQTNITQANDGLPFNLSVDVKVANL